MFFSSKTVDALTEDHKKLRKEFKILGDCNLSLKERRNAFTRLIPNLVSHSRREERVIYSFMKSLNKQDLRAMAFAGEEEHLIVDRLVEEMSREKTTTEEWSAKAKVLAELIEHHVDEEETNVFPSFKKDLNENTDDRLCRKYEGEASGERNHSYRGEDEMRFHSGPH